MAKVMTHILLVSEPQNNYAIIDTKGDKRFGIGSLVFSSVYQFQSISYKYG